MNKTKRVRLTVTVSLLLYSFALIAEPESPRILTIDEMFRLAEENSRSLKVEKRGIDVAENAIAVARAQRLPDINLQASANYLGNGFITDRDFSNFTKAPIPHFGNNFALDASWVVYSGGAIRNNIALAKVQKEQASTATSLNREQIRFLLLGQYLDLYKLDNQMKVYRQNIALTSRLIDNVKAKHEQGTALKNDITRYELQMENLKLELRKLQDQSSILNHQLCNSLGLPESTVIAPDTTILHLSMMDEEENAWQEKAANSSPLLKQSSLDIDRMRLQEKMERAEKLPKLSIVAANHFDGPITIEVPPINKNFNYWFVGMGISYNLASLYKNDKKVRQAQSAVEQSIASRDAVAEQLNNAVQADYVNYQQSFVELQTRQKSVELAQQNYQVVEDRYLNQLAIITDMIDASNMKLSAELQEVNARIGIIYAYHKMKYTAGTL
jgi:outer membrane protein